MYKEFDRQIQNLLDKDYPQILQLDEDAFKAFLEPLRHTLPVDGEPNIAEGKLPFVIVIKSPEGKSEALMEKVIREDKKGFSKLYPHEAKDFHTIPSIALPNGWAYLMHDIDRGKAFLNIRPDEALETINKQNRSPLTIDEGIAVITQFPEFLIKNNCFSLLASRVEGNKRVPAIWINAEKKPNLGWCWDGNPHTWLGSASCRERRS